jgi:TRAP-type C4-dicarboxylate transport system permease small subunit
MAGARFALKYFEEIVAGLFMVLMSLCTFANVVARYGFNSPIQCAEEFSRYAFIWVVFMGAAVCTKRGRHIAIDSLVQALPAPVQSCLHLLVDLCTLGLMAVIVYYGGILTAAATQTTATLKIPQYVVYLVVPVSAALIFLHALGDLRRHVRIALGGGGRP